MKGKMVGSALFVVLLIALGKAGIAAAQTDTCVGSEALSSTSEGCVPLTSSGGDNSNSAFGYLALSTNRGGDFNTAVGANVLQDNQLGTGNTATGSQVLQANTSGNYNTATGWNALESNTAGSDNTATGVAALNSNASGLSNTAIGESALYANVSGNDNTAVGDSALQGNILGRANTAIGQQALGSNTGDNNIGIGVLPSGAGGGDLLTTGSNNIDIGNEGLAEESGIIRIGAQGTQTAAYIAGIFGTAKIKKGCEVVVENTGLLGCVKSSARYKRDIRDMGDASDKLMKLRPVSFRYKADSTGTEQYGLIAEEVEQVYPELVIEDGDGRPETVAYQVLPAMLLNEVQKQSRQLAQKDAQIAAMQRQLVALQKKSSEIDALAERLDALERQARASRPDHLAALR
jgi:hypothetical protein